ncbi:hypothetical protein ACJMK2_025554 [Sinanodonta woodiana]|uniref:Uncharacterized protein n=1 Tax=Sinanodonta woodiana TaxID=1069815 RepID=A0ABD3XGU9_SINWO
MRSPTRTRLVVVRGSGNERKLVLLNDPGTMPLPNGKQLALNLTQTENGISRATTENSETSKVSNSLVGNSKIMSKDVDLSKSRRLRTGSFIRDQPLSTTPTTRAPAPVKVSGKAVDGVEINARGSFGDINIPKGIEVALKRLQGENWQLSRETHEHNNHVHVDSGSTVIGNNKLGSTDAIALKSPASRDANMVEAAARAFGTGLQTMPASRPQDVKHIHESRKHPRDDKVHVAPDGVIGKVFEPNMSNILNHQSLGEEKLNITDVVPLSILGISSSKELGLSAPSASVSALYRNTATNMERQQTKTSTSVALNENDSVGLKNTTVKVEPAAHVDEVLIADSHSSNNNINGEVPHTLIKSHPAASASAVRLASSSSSMRSTKVIQKSIQKTTFTKTRVMSAKPNIDTGAISAAGSDSMAVAANVGLNTVSLTQSMPSAAASTKQPQIGGSIEVQKQLNGKTKIILKDANNNPIVLQATGPVEIQRIVSPDGKIKFIVNPIRQPTTEETELDAEEILSVTTAATEETEVPIVESSTQSISTAKKQSAISTTDIISVTTLANRVMTTGAESKLQFKSSANAQIMKQEPRINKSRQVDQAVITHQFESSTNAIS